MPSYRLAAFSAWEKSCLQFRSARSCTTRRRTNTYLMLPRNDWRRRLVSTRIIGRPCQMNNGTATCTSTTSARRIGNSAPFRVSQTGPAGEDVTQSLLPGGVYRCKEAPARPGAFSYCCCLTDNSRSGAVGYKRPCKAPVRRCDGDMSLVVWTYPAVCALAYGRSWPSPVECRLMCSESL